jgi:predicted nucleic acid-binding protein
VKRVVADASVLAALAFNEPRAREAAERLDGAVVHAPTLLAYELANVAWKKARRDARVVPAVCAALGEVLDDQAGIIWCAVSHSDAVLISLATGLSTYDASYVWLAGFLGADLVTFDERLAAAAAA